MITTLTLLSHAMDMHRIRPVPAHRCNSGFAAVTPHTRVTPHLTSIRLRALAGEAAGLSTATVTPRTPGLTDSIPEKADLVLRYGPGTVRHRPTPPAGHNRETHGVVAARAPNCPEGPHRCEGQMSGCRIDDLGPGLDRARPLGTPRGGKSEEQHQRSQQGHSARSRASDARRGGRRHGVNEFNLDRVPAITPMRPIFIRPDCRVNYNVDSVLPTLVNTMLIKTMHLTLVAGMAVAHGRPRP
jgi:hypothetical protein